ncbi:hypothetical protein AB7A43_004684 [Salmonella enterica]
MKKGRAALTRSPPFPRTPAFPAVVSPVIKDHRVDCWHRHPAASPCLFLLTPGASPRGDQAVVNGASRAVSALTGFHPLRIGQRQVCCDRSESTERRWKKTKDRLVTAADRADMSVVYGLNISFYVAKLLIKRAVHCVNTLFKKKNFYYSSGSMLYDWLPVLVRKHLFVRSGL